MNKLMLAIIASLTAFSTQAKQMSRDTDYFHEPLLSRFEGTWEYVGDNSKFKIVLKMVKTYSASEKFYFDEVIGYHLYEKNGKVLQNSIGKQPSLTTGHYLHKDVSKDAYVEIFHDPNKRNTMRAILTLLPDGKMNWEVRDRDNYGIIGPGGKVLVKGDDHTYYVPKNMILTKVN